MQQNNEWLLGDHAVNLSSEARAPCTTAPRDRAEVINALPSQADTPPPARIGKPRGMFLQALTRDTNL